MSARRVCDGCGGKLPGPRGHGFVSRDGRSVRCERCEFRRPPSPWSVAGSWRRRPRVDVDGLAAEAA